VEKEPSYVSTIRAQGGRGIGNWDSGRGKTNAAFNELGEKERHIRDCRRGGKPLTGPEKAKTQHPPQSSRPEGGRKTLEGTGYPGTHPCCTKKLGGTNPINGPSFGNKEKSGEKEMAAKRK